MPTALELGPEGWRPFIEVARKKTAPSGLTPSEVQERARLMAAVRQAADALRKRFGPCRVVLFGSLAHGLWFHAHSDVDLAIEGISGKRFWEAWRIVDEVIANRNVDLVDLETAAEPLKKAIARHGIEL